MADRCQHLCWHSLLFLAISVVSPAEAIIVGQTATLIGRGDFGNGESGETTEDGRLRAATNIVEKIESGSIWFRFDEPASANVTPLEGAAGPGDSGGPAILEVESEANQSQNAPQQQTNPAPTPICLP